MDALIQLSCGVRRIPPEILLHIFNIFNEDYQSDPTYHSLRTNKGVWTIGKICQEWRAIVTDASNLWSDICLILDSPEPNSAHGSATAEIWEHSEDIISLQLTRSRDVPLNVHLAAFRASTTTLPIFTRLAIMISKHHHRWKIFELDIRESTMSVYNALASLPSAPMEVPMLERLELKLPSFIEARSEALKGLFAENGCPSLRNTSFHRNHFIFSSPAFTLPWSQIVTLEITFLGDLNPIISRISQFTNLCSLSISHSLAFFHPTVSLMTPCLLPRLKTFRSSAATVREILDSITAPALETLNLYSHRRTLHIQLNAETVNAFIARSQCSLAFFRCTCGDMEFASLGTVLSTTHELPHLSVVIGADEVEGLARGLMRRMGDGSLQYCPQLYHLVDSRPSYRGVESFIKMLECRSRAMDEPQSCLQRVGLDILCNRPYTVPDNLKDSMLMLKGSGLDIVFRLVDRDMDIDLLPW